MTLSFRIPFCRFPSFHPKAKGAQPCNQGLHAFVRIGNGVTYFCKYVTPLSRSWLDDIGIIAGFTKIARGFLQIIKKFLRHSFPAARPAFKHFATNSHTRFPYINIRCCSRTVIPAFSLFSGIVIQGTFLFSALYILFFAVKVSLFFLPAETLSWYKTSSESFPMIKDMQSPPLSRIQPDFFVKCSLNWYSYLFSYAWKSLSISFCPIAFCRQFYFLFCVKDSLNRKKLEYHPQPTTRFTSHRTTWFTHIFSLRENFSLFDALFFVYRCFIFVVSLFIVSVPVVSLFILSWKLLFFLRLAAKLFSFCVKIPLFSLSNFSIQQAFLTLQRYYFCVLYFSFSSWKPLSVPYGFRLIYAPLHPMLLSFLFAWNFLSTSSAKTLYF